MRYEDASQAGSITAGSEPIARPDVETLAPGSSGPGTGNAISGLGTTSGSAGADKVDNAPGTIVELQGAGGAATPVGNGFQAPGQYGSLTMEASGSFNYVRNSGTPDGVQDVFQYTLADAAGARSSTSLTVVIPRVIDQQAAVNLPAGVEMSDIRVNGRDLVIQLPDGTQMVIPGGAVFVPELSIGDVIVPPTNLAALLIDSEPEPGSGRPFSGGGNFEEEVPNLDPGVPLGDLLPPRDADYIPPEFEDPMEIVDREPTIIIITPDNPAGAINATASVDESGLPERPGEPEGTLEPQAIESTSGTIIITAEDGIETIAINGTVITQVGQQVAGQHGVLTITSINLDTGQIGYTYAATDNTTDGVDDFEDFTVVVTDDDGDAATGTLHINILDDEPIAEDDVDQVDLQANTATGNVMTGVGTTTGLPGADTVGADDATLTAVEGDGGSDDSFDADGNLIVDGAYGTLTIDAQGNYVYVPFGDSPGGTEDVFTYTLTDGDGDVITATLTIINPDQAPTAGANPVVQLDDDALAGGNPGGTNDDPNSVNATGTLSGGGGDGDLTFDLLATGAPDGFTYVDGPNGSILVQQVQDGDTVTVLTITVDPATGAYTVVQNANILHPDGQTENNVVFTINYTVTDEDGDTVGSSLTVNVDDDTPLAANDTDSVGEEGTAVGNVITGVGTNQGTGNADRPGADGFAGITALAGVTTDSNPSGGFTVEGEFGTLVMDANGEYTYTRDPEISEGGTDVFTYTYVDGDGDTVSATLTITVPDINSVPEILSSENLTVDEDGLLAIRNDDEGQINPTESNNGGNATDSGEITVAYGNDQPANLGDAITFINPAALNGQLTQGGLPITFSIDGSGNLIGQVNGVGPAVVTIAFTTVSETNGIVTYGYQVTLSGQVDQAYPNGDQTEAGITLTGVQFQVTDSDGETDTSSFNVTIFDDVPSADDFEVTQDAEDQGSPVVVDITVGLEEGADGVDLNDVTWEVTSGIEANLSFDPTTGEFTYDPDNSETGDVIFTYTVVDGDGDEITQTVTIHLASDTAPSIESVDNVIVDEDGLAGIANEDEAGLQDDPEELDANEDADVTGEIEVDYGNDLPADVDGAIALVDNGSLDNQLVSLDGDPILFTLEGGELVGRADTDGDDIGDSAPLVVISLVAGATTDGTTVTYTYRVQLLGPIGHPEGDDIETEVTLTGVDFVVTDSDGTETAGSFDVDIFDDVPSADDFEVTQDAEDQGSPVVVDITVGLEEGADGVDLNDVTWEVTSGIEANLSFDPTTGEFTYDPDNSETGDVIFTYTVVDGDGDEITQTVTIHLASDTAPSIESVDNVIVDEDGLAGIANEDEAGLQDDPEELDANEDADVTGEIEVDYGNDLPADVDGAIALVDNGSLDNQLVSLDGDPILFTLEGGELVGRADTDGDDIGDSAPLVVISLVAGATTDGTTVTYTYRVQLLGPIGHPEGDDIETEVTLTGVDFVVTDSDGTETAGSFDVDIFDDVPSATDEAEQNVGEGDTATGTFDFVEGADGASVTHVNGTVLVFDEVTGWSQQVNLGSGSSIIVKADGSYEFTAGDPTLGTPSITGTFTVTDGDGDQVEADFEFDVTDEYGPTASSPTAWVDDDGFPTGNPDSIDGDHADDDLDGDGDETTYSGNLVTSFGGDLAGSVNFADMDGDSEAIGQETVTYSWNALTNTLTATITASPDDSRESTTLFTVVVTPGTGDYTVTLEQNVLHTPSGDDTEGQVSVTLDYNVLDSDGTTATGVLTLNFDDDMPSDFTPVGAIVENTGAGSITEKLDTDLTLGDNIGADQPASLVFAIPDNENGTPLLNTDDQPITVGGQPVLLFLEDDGSITATTDRDDPDATVFTATLDLTTSSYTIEFDRPLDNGSTSASDFTGAAAGNQDWIGIDPDLFLDPPNDPEALDIEDTDDPNPDSVDLLVTAFAHDDRAPDTVNRDNDDIGAGGGQSNGPDETLRIDFVQDLTRDAGQDEQDPGGYNFDTHVGQLVFSFTMIDTVSDDDTAVLIEAFNVDDETASKDDVTDITNNDKVLIDPATIVVKVGNDILEQGVDYQVYPDGSGGYYLSPIPEGAVVSFQAVGGVTFEAVEITNAAGHDIPGSDPLDQFEGANFAIGGFSYGVNDPGDPVEFVLPVELTDSDGDTSEGTIDVTVYPVGQVPTGTTATTALMMQESLSDTSDMSAAALVASNDNADQAQARAFNIGNQAALMGVLAAAGLNASAQLAVKDASSALDLGSLDKVGHSALAATRDSAPVESDDGAAAVSALAASGEVEASGPAGRTSANQQSEASNRLDTAANDDGADSLSALHAGTDATAAAAAHGSMTAAAVAMPSMEMVAALEGEADALTATAGPTVASTQEVGRVLADALQGGQGPDIGALLDAATGSAGPAGQAALDALASIQGGGVSSGYSGHAAGFANGHGVLLVDALANHHDAPPAV